ncbi:MAG: acyl-CoA desaturase [Crocinitomicaceae bacterium]|nr:acyl-CoA desaturase [Crocinitomicaceae bacterium]
MAKVSFANRTTPFFDELRREVDAYFVKNQICKTGDWRLFFKSIIILSCFFASYIAVVFILPPGWISFLICGFFGFVMALVGFNVMHDACHGSYSSSKIVNHLMGYSMNLLGSNQFIWKMKHNRIHHTFTNVDGVDDDIMKVPVLRHCRSQRYYKAHRYQHIYGFFVYAISTILWVSLTDGQKYFSRSISGTPILHISFSEHLIFWISKLFYVGFYIVVPVMMVGWLPFLVGYLFANIIFGLTLSLVFQMAHAVETTHFDNATEQNLVIEKEWAEFQVMTTADFSQGSPVANWLLGGLNFQVVHHLFPMISHIHYRDLQPIVKRVCEKHSINYKHFPTFIAALQSHINYLKLLGREV